MSDRNPDHSLDTLLDLNGQVLVIDEAGYWVKFTVHRVPVSTAKPQGIDYSLTLHGPGGERLIGFDNAHQIKGKRRTGHDHKHRFRSVQSYEYKGADVLIADFWAEVEAVMREKGVWL